MDGSPSTATTDQLMETSRNGSQPLTATSNPIGEHKLVTNLFEGILERLRGLNLFREKFLHGSPSIFLVYAHDNPSVDKAADSNVVRYLIEWLSKLRSNLYSDRSSGYDPASTPKDKKIALDVLSSQLCLLPRDNPNHSVKKVILCGSELLGQYIRSDCYHGANDKPYTQAIQHAYRTALQAGKSENDISDAIREVVNDYSGKEGKGFHHVLTELAFLHIRADKLEHHGIIPFLLNGSFGECFPKFIWPTTIRIEPSPGEGGLHKGFFKLLKLLLENKERERDIQAFQDCYDKCINRLQDGQAPLEPKEFSTFARDAYLTAQRDLMDHREATLNDRDAILQANDFYSVLINTIKPRVPLDRLQATLEEYASSERLSIERVSGQSLPMERCYVNLAVIERPKLRQEKQESNQAAENEWEKPNDTFRRLPSFEAMNSNTQALVPLQDLFNPRELSDGKTEAPKRILIRGRAGVGKTTLSKKIVYEYTRHQMWRQQFSLLLWVPLRKLKRKRFVSLTDFFREEYFRQDLQGRAFAETLSEHIQGPDKAKTLFILDGWDEIQGWKVDESIETLRRLLNHPTVIITSRPAGVNLSSIDPMDLELETIGFSQENISAYLEHEEVVSSEAMATDIKQFVQSNPFVQEVVNVPIQLDAFCYSWDEIKQMRQADHPFTVTTLYQAMIHKLWRKDILRLEKQDHGIPLTAEIVNALRYSKRLTRAVQSESDFLSALAFDRFQENQIEFTNREIDHVIEKLEAKGMQLPLTLESNLTKLSFLHADDRDVARDQHSYHFMHLTFQEFFAAQWLVKLLTSDPSQVEDCVRWHKYDPRYEIVWRFMAGLLQDHAALNSFFDWLDQGPQDLLGIQHQHLVMHCLNESKGRLNNPERQQTLELNLCEWVEFEIKTMGGSTLGVQVAFPEAWLLRWLKGESKRADIITVLAKRPVLSEEAIECLTALLKDTDNNVRDNAAKALGRQPNLPLEAIEGLIALLKDRYSMAWPTAAKALGRQSNLPTKAIEGLVALLKAPDIPGRYYAAEVLGRQPNLSLEAIEGLIALLKDRHWLAQLNAAAALGRQLNLPTKAIEGWVALLTDTDSSVRSSAAEAFGRHSNLPTKAIEGLVALLTDTDSSVRCSVAEVFGRHSNLPTKAIEGLVALLTDTDIFMRFRAAEALGRQSNLPPGAIKGLVALLADTSSFVRSKATEALGRQSNLPAKAIEGLIALLVDTDSHVRSMAAEALGRQSNLPPEAIEGLIALLVDTDVLVRSMAARALSRQSNLHPEVIKDLMALLKDTDNLMRSRAAGALGRRSNLPPEAIEGLVALLADTDSLVRSMAAEALGGQSNLPPEAIKDLTALLADTSSFVRSKAAEALGRRSNLPPEAIKGLVALLADTDSLVRSRAAEALGGQSNLPPEAIKDLMALLKDTDYSVRSSAIEALGRHSNLPTKAIEGLIGLLKDTENNLQFGAARVLDRQRIGQLCRCLETLERSSMECLYSQYLVRWNVAQITPLYLEGSTLYFYTSSKLESVSLREEAAFRQTLLEVQKRTGIPSASWVKTSKAVAAIVIEHPAYAWPTWHRPTGIKGSGRRRRSWMFKWWRRG